MNVRAVHSPARKRAARAAADLLDAVARRAQRAQNPDDPVLVLLDDGRVVPLIPLTEEEENE